ncbi:alpha/beta hydrolase [Devosia sp. LjRoot3]|jgi:pimeloyl-ACP methyl ester carboxylesterase|uniref:alpha/beta hydrolase n=1 Tax=Devosia sp. LjRoot3 TaxID=3342319 RepID=UPI003ED08588
MSMERYFPYYQGTPFFSLQKDSRFSYCLYVPPGYHRDEVKSARLVVAVHGTKRTAEGYRDAFASLAEETGCVVLAPLFPMGVYAPYSEAPEEQHNYKYLEYKGLRFDEILIAMVEEVRAALNKLEPQFLLFGFSGGGQFVHRFYYLHPDHLLGVSVGAPGSVTRIDPAVEWWPGTGGFGERFGKEIDLEALRRVPVHLVVGALDTETWNVGIKPESWTWREGANDAGANRVERLAALRQNLELHGISVTLSTVEGVAHSGTRVLEPVFAFFRQCLVQKDSK